MDIPYSVHRLSGDAKIVRYRVKNGHIVPFLEPIYKDPLESLLEGLKGSSLRWEIDDQLK